jgi:hypothetical protein
MYTAALSKAAEPIKKSRYTEEQIITILREGESSRRMG